MGVWIIKVIIFFLILPLRQDVFFSDMQYIDSHCNSYLIDWFDESKIKSQLEMKKCLQVAVKIVKVSSVLS